MASRTERATGVVSGAPGDMTAEAGRISALFTSSPSTAEADSAPVQALLRKWVALDTRAAVDWALAFPEPLRHRLVYAAVMEIARQRPDEIPKWLHLLADEQNGTHTTTRGAGRVVAEAVRLMLARDPEAGLAWLRREWAALCTKNAQGDDAIAEELSEAIGAGQISLQEAWGAMPAGAPWTIQRLWPHLSVPHLAEAAAWFRDSGDQNLHRLLPGLVTQWAEADAPAAADFMKAVTDPSLLQMFHDWPALDMRRVRFLPQKEQARFLARQLRPDALDIYETDDFPATEYARMLAGMPASADSAIATSKLAQVWGALDPHRSVEWAAGLPDATQRSAALAASVKGWAGEDAWGASQWLVQQPAGEMRDHAAAALAGSLAAEEPDSAWQWAGDIGDATVRVNAMSAVLDQWRKADPAAADAAIAALPADEQTALKEVPASIPPQK